MVAWAADGHTLFFTRERSDLRRQPHELIRLDVAARSSEVVFEEADERLNLGIRRSDSGAWLFLDVNGVHRGTVEVWCLPADQPSVAWRRLVTREFGHQVVAEHWQDKFLFLVDDAGPYRRLVRAPIEDSSPSGWEEVIPHRNGVTLEEVHLLEHHLVLLERDGLRPRLVSRDKTGRIGATIVPDEPSCTLTIGLSAGGHYSVARHAFRASRLTYRVSSFVRPDTVVEHDLADDKSAVRYQARIPGYDAAQYVATVVMAEAEDGVQVPISVVARRDRVNPGPVILIAAAEGLVERGLATRDGIVIEGQSGGGGTVLAAAALRPDLFRAVLAEVPVADILDTELDFTLPYALQETAEYGDPHIAHEYRYLRSYDPYYNLSADRPLRRPTSTARWTTVRCSTTSPPAMWRIVGPVRPIATPSLSSARGWWAATAALHMGLASPRKQHFAWPGFSTSSDTRAAERILSEILADWSHTGNYVQSGSIGKDSKLLDPVRLRAKMVCSTNRSSRRHAQVSPRSEHGWVRKEVLRYVYTLKLSAEEAKLTTGKIVPSMPMLDQSSVRIGSRVNRSGSRSAEPCGS